MECIQPARRTGVVKNHKLLENKFCTDPKKLYLKSNFLGLLNLRILLFFPIQYTDECLKVVKTMIINNIRQAGVASLYTSQQPSARKNLSRGSYEGSDEIVLSTQAKSFGAALSALRESSGEIRQDKVDFYRDAIASGEYSVDSGALAEQILDTRY